MSTLYIHHTMSDCKYASMILPPLVYYGGESKEISVYFLDHHVISLFVYSTLLSVTDKKYLLKKLLKKALSSFE